jgi:hypothetical protein
MVSRTQKEVVIAHINAALESGARCLYGGVDAPGNYMQVSFN